MKNYSKPVFWFFVLLMFAGQAMAQQQGADMGQVINLYKQASTVFGAQIKSVAEKLAFLLFTIDLVWLVLSKNLKGADLPEILTATVMRVMWLGFLLMLMRTDTLGTVISGFVKLGESGSGLSVFNPADVFWQGVDLVNIMTTKFADGANIMGVPVPAGVAAVANPLVAMTTGLSIVVIVLAYLIMTAQYVSIVLQMYFYLACYPILLAMGATKFGNDMSMKAISAAIVIGVRFLAMYFVLSIASSMGQVMGSELANLSLKNLSPMWAVLGMSGLLAFLAMKVPQMASDLLGGTASLSGGDAIAAGAAAGGAVAAAGGAVGAATGTLSGALKAGGAAINQAQAVGATGLVGTLASAAGAVARGVGGAAADGIKSLGSGSAGQGLANRINAQTAGIQELQAAGGQPPAPPVSPSPSGGGGGGQPPAPAVGGGAATATASAPGASTGGAAATPPAPSTTGTGSGSGSGSSSPTQVSSSGATTASATGGAPAPGAGAGANSFSSQPPAPPIEPDAPATGAGGINPNNLVQELKSADSVQGASVQIGAPAHD